MQVDSAVVVLAEDARGKSSESPKKASSRKDSPSSRNVLQKVQLRLKDIEKKITELNSNCQKYVSFLSLLVYISSVALFKYSIIC